MPIAHVTGNGRMTVALDEAGVLSRFYWPGAGSVQQLAPAGGRWYLAEPKGPVAFEENSWTIEQDYASADSLAIVTRYTDRGGARRAEQTVKALPGLDLLLVHLRLYGFPPDARVCWVQSFVPYEHQVPVLYELQAAIGAANTFASGFDPATGILEQFRPLGAGQEDWTRLHRWAAGGADPGFARAICLGAVSPQKIAGVGITRDWATWSGWEPGGVPSDSQRAEGESMGIMELVPANADGALEAVVVIGASDSREGLRDLLLSNVARGVGTGRGEQLPPGVFWLESGKGIAAQEPVLERARLNLLLCVSGETGAVLNAPAQSPNPPRCDVLDSVWASAGLDALGHGELARRAIEFHIKSIRRENGVETAAGSLPRFTYPSGVAAAISDHGNPECAAWLLAACCRHALSLPESERKTYLEPIWSSLELSIDYLARDPGVGEALSGSQPPVAISLETLRTHYLGLESGRQMLALLGGVEPALWSDRRSEIYSRIRFRKLNQTDKNEKYQPWIDWWIRALPGNPTGAESAWEVLASAGTPPLDASAIGALEFPNELSSTAPIARRDALRCLALTSHPH